MSFFSLLFGNDEKTSPVKAVRVPSGGTNNTSPLAQVGGEGSRPNRAMLNTPTETASAIKRQCNGEPKRLQRHSATAPANRDRLSLWSRLLCRPEVYDPHVEAAPLTHLLDVEPVDTQPQEHVAGCTDSGEASLQKCYSVRSSSGEGRCAATPLPEGDDENCNDSEDAVISGSVLSASIDVEEFEEAEVQSPSEVSNTAELLLNPQVFHVFDTRRCRVRMSTVLSSPTSATNLRFTTTFPNDSGTLSMDTTESDAASSRGSVSSAERRLISPKELAKKHHQRRQQSKQAAKRAREYKEAWAALVASTQPHASGATHGEAAGQTDVRSAEGSGPPSIHPTCALGTSTVTSHLTNEALESLRKSTQPVPYDLPVPFLARLCHYAPPPKKAKDVAEEENNRAESCCSRSSTDSSQVALDDELVSIETELPVMYGAVLRCRDSASRAREHDGKTSPSCTRLTTVTALRGSQRSPAGRYPLGSRAYVERVLFAQRRQQEWALFALLTEAHRQAREAHVRLAQLYYYYIIPILAQYRTEADVRGLERSLLMCGSGALRMYHTKFCRTVVYSRPMLQRSAHGDTSYSIACYFQVQPVDYQLVEYRFENPWRELFLEVKAYLGMQAREDASCSTLPTLSELENGASVVDGTTSTGHGSVCVAATVLHSMELFERQRHTHSAARDAEEWLTWYYYYFTPRVLSADSAEKRAAVQRSLLPPPPPPSSTRVSQREPRCGNDYSRTRASDSKAPQPALLESEYLPLSWIRACNTAEREKVLNYRRDLKLRVMKNFPTHRPVAPGYGATARAVDSPGTVRETSSTLATTATSVKASRETVSANVAAASSGCQAVKHVSESRDLLNSAHETEGGWLLAEHVEADLKEAGLLKPSAEVLPEGAISRQSHDTAEVEDGNSEETDDEDGAIPTGTHCTVSVGCFGLSFFSIFE
uniref:Uncharacterized protein n=1 Tax=Leishmania utingensis TaxID=653362 RepID=A0AAW3A4A0_9TRYP